MIEKHIAKVAKPKPLRDNGIDISVNKLQPRKASFPNSITLGGIVTFTKEVQCQNKPFAILFIDEGNSI